MIPAIYSGYMMHTLQTNEVFLWVLLLAGLAISAASLFVWDAVGSTILGAAAFSCFWGIHEILSQEMRVIAAGSRRIPSGTTITSADVKNSVMLESTPSTRE